MIHNKIFYIAIGIIPLLFSMVIHEVAHGWAALKLGDSTAKDAGRLTLNPIAHLDPMMSVAVPLLSYFLAGVFFGGAKPVPVNPYRFHPHIEMRRGMMIVAAAGPLSNLILAFVSAFFYVAAYRFFPNEIIITFFEISLMFNIMLCFFNLIPIPPLDGSRILHGFLPREYDRIFITLERYGFIIIMALVVTGAFSYLLIPAKLILKLFIWIPSLIFG